MIQKTYIFFIAALFIFLPYAWFEPSGIGFLVPLSFILLAAVCFLGYRIAVVGSTWRETHDPVGFLYIIILSVLVFGHLAIVRSMS